MSILDKIKTMKKAGPSCPDLLLIKPSQCSSIGVVYSVETVLDATTGPIPPLPTRMLPSFHHRWYCPPDSGTAWKARQLIALSGEVIPCFFPLIRCQSWLAIANTSGNREGSPGSFLLNRICGGDANIVTAVVIWAMVQISRLIQSTREKGVIVPPWTRHLHALT